MADITGIHHVTALAGDPAVNLAFYTGTLGLRLVKKTINFDDPTTYHLYFGDRLGRPGTLITFFPHPLAREGAPGTSEVATIVFNVPPGSLSYWRDRLSAMSVAVSEGSRGCLDFTDPHGTRLALIEAEDARGTEPPAGEGVDVSAEHAIRGIEGVSLAVPAIEPTAAFLTSVMGYREVKPPGPSSPAGAGSSGPAWGHGRWFEVGEGGAGQRIELRVVSGPRARLGAGSVHHVAFRTPDDASQARMQELIGRSREVTPVQDRNYFRSIYFREPGGVIFEIATDPPGFLIDEDEPSLGKALKLPPQYEPHRELIERQLPSLEGVRA